MNYVDDDLVATEDGDNDDDDHHHGDLVGDVDEAEGDGSGEMRPVLAQRAQCPLPVSTSPFSILYFGKDFEYLYLNFQILCGRPFG